MKFQVKRSDRFDAQGPRRSKSEKWLIMDKKHCKKGFYWVPTSLIRRQITISVSGNLKFVEKNVQSRDIKEKLT